MSNLVLLAVRERNDARDDIPAFPRVNLIH
jgi:hypothetical protein